MNDALNYGRQYIDESDIKNILKSLSSEFLTTGPLVTVFEEKLCELTGARYAVVCSNGTSALHLACLALNINDKCFGITSPITFLASANCIEYCRGTADFIDISPEFVTISVDELDEYCKKKKVPDVVIPVDFAGVPADLPQIWKLSKEYGFYVIEDAAHAIGSQYEYDNKNFKCGGCTHSDMSVFSFHPVKTITTGEGGAVLTNNERLAQLLRLYRNHGIKKNDNECYGGWYYEMVDLGFNYRITDIQCALGISQLDKLLKFKKRRREIVNKYNDSFSKINGISIPSWPENTDPCFHLYILRFTEKRSTRRLIYDKLIKKNILPQIHYIPVYWQPYYKNKYNYQKGKCPNAENYYDQCLSLPLFPAMKDSEVEYIISSVTEIIQEL